MKKILGLDLGTNSIGWALINQDLNKKQGAIIDLGSRIIPMSQDVLGKFDSGVSISQTAERTAKRGARRLVQRFLLRRERLHRVLNILDFLPKHYSETIDFEKRLGQFKPETEEKLPFYKNENGKNKFIFIESHNEMLKEFKINFPEIKKIPYDWTIYYLRKKALSSKITKEELAWILLNFNQKRGYYQLRGEDEEIKPHKLEEFHSLTVNDVTFGDQGKDGIWYNVILENGWIYRRQSKVSLNDWIGKTKDFIVTTDLNEDGSVKTDKDGKEKRSFRAPKEDDWGLVKKRTEQNIGEDQTVGCYIYDSLLKNPSQKIRGSLVRTIERKYYKKELKEILEKQIELNPAFFSNAAYQKCIKELYANNDAHRNTIAKRGFLYLLMEDIILYQRPLKSKISQISNCQYETRRFFNKEKNELVIQPLKCISKSHPLFQEFRLWQFISNLKIYKKTTTDNVDVTNEFIPSENETIELFDFLNDKESIDQDSFLKYFLKKKGFKGKDLTVEVDKYRWNMVEDKSYPCNETRSQFLTKISQIDGVDNSFFTYENSFALWHILYSVSDKIEINQAIKKFVSRNNLPEECIDGFAKIKPYKSDYGSYSEKAIKKLLPLMRKGKYWNENSISIVIKSRIEQIKERLQIINFEEKKIADVIDDDITQALLKSFIKTTNFESGLNTYQACYLVYGRHSESINQEKWSSPQDITWYLDNKNPNGFKQHSLRNPIVEQVITETLRTVKDIWQQYGNGEKDFFNEIHIELGREMKNPADKRKRMSEQVSQNENTNMRIKAILQELKEVDSHVRPYSPSQQEILKIYEEGVFGNESRKEKLDEIEKIRRNNKPSKSDIQRYKLWLEQGYISPYTGQTIMLSELFTTKYEIEHIFPQSRFFDDSQSNKVICESEVNKLKDNKTAMEFIIQKSGSIITLSNGKNVTLFTTDNYKKHIETYFSKNRTKLKNLLSEEIPESFINRQLNDSRYISKVIKMYLSKIVRDDKNGAIEDEATSKNVIPVTGSITSKMKQDWGLNNVWNDLITPRFERLNQLTNSLDFGQWENKDGKRVFQTTVPEAIAKGFSKKRIDHRHHALDALVIACLSRTHINYLNNLNAKDENDKTTKHELRNKICYKTKPDQNGNYKWLFYKPWETFTENTKEKLNTTIISFKQNVRVINKSVNKYQSYKDENGVLRLDKNGNPKKEFITQTQGDNWAIRKPIHAETVSGKVFLKRIKQSHITTSNAIEQVELIVDKEAKKQLKAKIKLYPNNSIGLKKHLKAFPIMIDGKAIEKVQIYETVGGDNGATATRKLLDTSFDEKKIQKITDTGIQKILLEHLKQTIYQTAKDESGKVIPPHEAAFSEEGLDAMNDNIQFLNGGKNHQPIKKVRIFEESNKFQLGQLGHKKDKYVETAKGTNLFFAVYQDADKNKKFITIPLENVIENQKKGYNSVPDNYIDEKSQNIYHISQYLSINDLVYIPTIDEIENSHSVDFQNLSKEQITRLYNVNDFSGYTIYFTPNTFSKNIATKELDTSFDSKMSKTYEGDTIKEKFWKLDIDRLGKIKKITK
ncbi:type II CRISPR RNA-guided endonuclease Cas9 [Flavobacterium sp. 7A]|uniref:type II CRISPR RNA-guided endonuclease Cas9 n=1 Tax=Flavobacterium sp. 7A TaxID=2940571 RepID=UPI002226F53D|nr:type II CRISPR RNA-guided endonuclease Cas9 [Flavobacterium sp. 7A]MCW2119601.1 CRISPR-associated endonuclease Csn1 [Flavobacterium sp. 7A]